MVRQPLGSFNMNYTNPLSNQNMDQSFDSTLQTLCFGLLIVSIIIFLYCVYTLIKAYTQCTSEMKQDIPCPNTCSEGYECKPTDEPTEFVIGDVVTEGMSDVELSQEEAPVVEAASEAEAVEAEAPVVEEAAVEADAVVVVRA